MTNYHLTFASSNPCTGPIPVSTTSEDSCPSACPLKGGACYARFNPRGIGGLWKKVSNGKWGGTFSEFLKKIQKLPKGQLVRFNQAGDLPGKDNNIDVQAMRKLIKANVGKRGFTYTHKPILEEKADSKRQAKINRDIIAEANAKGFTINLSANNAKEADTLAALNVAPIVTVMPEGFKRPIKTAGGNTIIPCPEKIGKGLTCATCGLCAIPQRKAIIGFPVHGTGRKMWQEEQ